MKKNSIIYILFLFTFILISNLSHGSDLDVVITIIKYPSGTDITCHGVHDGAMEAVIVGGVPPYSYQWTNGTFTAYTKKITNLVQGDYVFTVIDGNNDTAFKSAKIYDVTAITTSPELTVYEGGYNISYQGADDGQIHLSPSGGTPPYTFHWSNGIDEENLGSVTAGTYTVTITDDNQCTHTASFTMTEPTPLHVVSLSSPLQHGYNISCYGGSNGSLSLTVDGGVPPYTYSWNVGDTTNSIDSLKIGTYTVQIYDANAAHLTRSIVLTEPAAINYDLAATTYGNGKNTSCFNCSDGYVTSNANGGVSPYTYLWNTGQTTANLSAVIARNYSLVVTDVNGCTKSKEITLTQPDREDWTVKGNAGTNADSNYIGTNDNKDFRIRTNGTERLRIYSTGMVELKSALKVDTISSDSLRSVFVDSQGVLRIGSHGTSQQPCVTPTNRWVTDYCNHTNDIYNLPTTGNVGIGTSQIPSGYKLAVNGKIICEEVKVKLHSTWPDFVFKPEYKLMPLHELKQFINQNKHLPEIPSASEVEQSGNSLGEMQTKLLQKIEELTLYLVQQNEKIEKLQSENVNLNTKLDALSVQVKK
ncbi:MAG: SprB repeat-containing protein [Bacteroidetes bacterium]|nr:SprB repeat-containing protein [Bacteroidota bacterium]MBL0140297.1 SprB repeat-containing protein [Bacteroidota bacterium]